MAPVRERFWLYQWLAKDGSSQHSQWEGT